MWNKGIRFTTQRVFLSAMAILCIIPMAFLVRDSLSLFGKFTLSQYEDILLYQKEFHLWFWNSVIYTVVILVIQIPVSVLAAYGFTQYEFPGKKMLFSLYILALLLPFQATVVSQYLTLDAMHLLDTRLAVILPNAYKYIWRFSYHPIHARDLAGNPAGSAAGGGEWPADFFPRHTTALPACNRLTDGFTDVFLLVPDRPATAVSPKQRSDEPGSRAYKRPPRCFRSRRGRRVCHFAIAGIFVL